MCVCECVFAYHGLHILISKSLKSVFGFQDMKTQKIKNHYSHMFSTKQKRNENTITFNFTLIIHTDIFFEAKNMCASFLQHRCLCDYNYFLLYTQREAQ